MNFTEIYNKFDELKKSLQEKKEAIKTRNLDALTRVDETIIVLLEQINALDLKNSATLTTEEKEKLKQLAKEIKEIEEINEILIKHSLDVINKMLSGILNITANEKTTYNSKGNSFNQGNLDISSITEEA